MKYNLKKYLPTAVAIVVASSMIFNATSKIKDDKKKDENPKTGYENEIDDTTLTSKTSLLNLKEKISKIFNKEAEETTFSFNQPEETTREIEMKIKILYDRLMRKYFNKIGTQKIDMECRVSKDKIFSKSEITINATDITNGEGFYKLLRELSDVCIIKTLNVDSQTVNQIEEYDLSFIEELEVKAHSKYIGVIDVKNFTNLRKLSLERVNASNISKSVEKLEFNGDNHSVYDITKELEFIKNSKNIWAVSFKNIEVPNVTMPATQIVYLDFTNCEGDKNINITNSNDVYIKYHNTNNKNENIIVNGTITSNMFYVGTSENISTGNLKGDPVIDVKLSTSEGIIPKDTKSLGK